LSVEVHALASGSSGNSALVIAEGQALLIDAGISARRLSAGLKARNVFPGALKGVILTHEHDDHIKGIELICKKLDAPLVANHATIAACSERMELPEIVVLPSGNETRIGLFTVRSFRVSHDAVEPVGYVIQAGNCRIFYATDCGCLSTEMRLAMVGASLCILESNHDVEWLRRGPYPPHMKARVAGDTGHLSNLDAANLLADRLESCGPASIWLAHLSAINNSPSLARRFVTSAIKSATRTPFTLDIALRDHPSVMWRSGQTAVQRSLF
jgi:phosphoribosyl 1,2-cyclic phosphodiesterase